MSYAEKLEEAFGRPGYMERMEAIRQNAEASDAEVAALKAERDRLRILVENAYYEGWERRQSVEHSRHTRAADGLEDQQRDWEQSIARAALSTEGA